MIGDGGGQRVAEFALAAVCSAVPQGERARLVPIPAILSGRGTGVGAKEFRLWRT